MKLRELLYIQSMPMHDRAAELGGTFAIQPAGSAGTCIEVRLPWRDEGRDEDG